MTYLADKFAEFVYKTRAAAGNFVAEGKTYTTVHKFGGNASIGTTFEPIASLGVYRTPQVSGATALRVKAGNTNDSASGSGARSITIQGLDETGALVEETIATNGTSAGANSTNTYLRLFRAYVATSGTYASQTTGSHSANIIIENAAGTEDWAQISATDFPRGQTQIGVYTIPLGKVGYIGEFDISVDSNKSVDLLLFQRRDILQTAAPYSAMRLVAEFTGVTESIGRVDQIPLGPFPALTDIGWMAKAASSADASVDFEILLVDE